MWIKKFDFDYGRRALLQKSAIGATAGVLAPLWPMLANSADDVSKAYPDELLHIAASAYAGPGDEVLYVRYGFSVYDIAARRVGATRKRPGRHGSI